MLQQLARTERIIVNHFTHVCYAYVLFFIGQQQELRHVVDFYNSN
jgi:hypothetical protein